MGFEWEFHREIRRTVWFGCIWRILLRVYFSPSFVYILIFNVRYQPSRTLVGCKHISPKYAWMLLWFGDANKSCLKGKLRMSSNPCWLMIFLGLHYDFNGDYHEIWSIDLHDCNFLFVIMIEETPTRTGWCKPKACCKGCLAVLSPNNRCVNRALPWRI